MNLTNITINLNALNQSISKDPINIKDFVCYQLNHQLIKTGIIIVVLYILYTWFSVYFFNSWYKKFKYDKCSAIGRFIGDLDILNTRLYWDIFIRDKFAKVMIGYIVMIIYFLIK